MSRFSCFLALRIISYVNFLADAQAENRVIPANEAAGHVGEYATVEGVVAKMFTSKSGNTFLNIGATYPNQTFTSWIPPASPVNESPVLSGIEGKKVKITGRIEIYKGSRRSGSMLRNSSKSNDPLSAAYRVKGIPC